MTLAWMPRGNTDNRLVSACDEYWIGLQISRDFPEGIWRASHVAPGGAGWLGDTPDVEGAKALCERDAQERNSVSTQGQGQ
jgi:hypothetical protein